MISVVERRGGGTFGYRPALDGLRALAVGAVIAYHFGYGWARGGFLGVDTFFVLSGYLITSLLLVEFRGQGTVRLHAFWARRARRLLPALLLMLAVVTIWAGLTRPADQLGVIRGDGLATLFYGANWRFIASGQTYFALVSLPSPFRHAWSLAIEEQFYLVWPLITLACLRLARGGHARTGDRLCAGVVGFDRRDGRPLPTVGPVARVLRHGDACARVADRRAARDRAATVGDDCTE